MDRQTALFRWLIWTTTQAAPADALRHMLHDTGLHIPPKVRKGGRARLAVFLLRASHKTSVSVALEHAVESFWGPVASVLERDRPKFVKFVRESPDFAVMAEWSCVRSHRAELFQETLASFDPALRAEVDARFEDVLAWAEREEGLQRDIAIAQAEVASGLDRARQQEQAAKALAVVALRREQRVASDAGSQLAAAQRQIRDLEAHVREVEQLLAERDEQVGRMIVAYEERLAASRQPGAAEPASLAPLAGRRVLVVGDPNRAAGYRAEAQTLGAVEVDFVDGMAGVGDRLASAVQAADVVVLNVAWMKHRVAATVRANEHKGLTVAHMRQSGLRAFREAVVAAVSGDKGAASGAPRSNTCV